MSRLQEKKKKEKKVYTYYEIMDEKLVRKLKKCPRCGSFMALHKGETARQTCGKCYYTEFQPKSIAVK